MSYCLREIGEQCPGCRDALRIKREAVARLRFLDSKEDKIMGITIRLVRWQDRYTKQIYSASYPPGDCFLEARSYAELRQLRDRFTV